MGSAGALKKQSPMNSYLTEAQEQEHAQALFGDLSESEDNAEEACVVSE